MKENLLYYSVVACWGINIFCLARFARQWYKREPERARCWLTMGAIAVPALLMTAFLPARGGYDNNHDFMCLGQSFFTDTPRILLSFKELSPLFTDWVSDALSGNSLTAILWKNRLLPVFSLFVLFTGLRRLGASVMVSAAAGAFLFLNFLSALNASAFSTTTANVFIWLTSLLALFDAYAAEGPAAPGLAWIMASMVLVISARFELLPANLLLFSALLAAKKPAERSGFLKPVNLLLMGAGACVMGFWASHALDTGPARQLGHNFSALRHLVYQLGARNLAVIAGLPPAWTDPSTAAGQIPEIPFTGLAALLSGFFLLTVTAGTAAGAAADRSAAGRQLGALSLLALWALYFSFIFTPMDLYPLHFMRHQLYFFIPFVFLFSLGLNGLESAAGKLPGAGRSRLYALCCVCLAVYAALNARAALGFNGELRTNDRELAFLAEAQRAWPPDRLVVFPRGNRTNSRFELIAKYFPPMPDCAGGTTGKLLKYVSPEPAVFSYNTAFFSTDALDQAPLIAGPGASPWRTTSFKHAFYTGLFRSADPMEETREPKQLTIGFFNIEDRGRDKALLDVLSGVCALDSGDYSGAAGKFQLAAADDRTCLNCKYFLAIARAALGEKAAAEAELAKIDKALPAALSREQRGLVKELELGETEKAAGLALAITDRNPEFFFRKDIAGALRARLSPRVQ